MNKERLIALADFVDKQVDPKQFNMSRFFSKLVDKDKPEIKCGTTACLAGWACTMPEFQKDGLKVGIWESYHTDMSVPLYQGLQSFRALALFFDLTAEQAEYLFGEYNDQEETRERHDDDIPTATGRIRSLVATGVCNWEKPDPDEE